MADLELGSAVVKVWDDGGVSSKLAAYACRNVDTGDTVDLSPHFSVVKRGGFMSDTSATTSAIAAAGAVVTFPANLADDGGLMMIFGVDATLPEPT